MRLINLEKIHDIDVYRWLDENIPEITQYQKREMREREIVRFNSIYFMRERKKTKNVFLRFSIIFILPVFLLLLLGIPFYYFATGEWGYKHGMMKWYSKWVNSCGL